MEEGQSSTLVKISRCLLRKVILCWMNHKECFLILQSFWSVEFSGTKDLLTFLKRHTHTLSNSREISAHKSSRKKVRKSWWHISWFWFFSKKRHERQRILSLATVTLTCRLGEKILLKFVFIHNTTLQILFGFVKLEESECFKNSFRVGSHFNVYPSFSWKFMYR